LILFLAIFAGLVESSFNRTLHSIARGISENKLLFVFAIWYLAGFILNAFLRGSGLDDWRLMLSPVVILVGLLYALAYMHDERAYRSVQISLIIVFGLQTFFTVQVLSGTADIARTMWSETLGAWIYGNQYIYATYAMILPILIWRSLKESGFMRLILMFCCLLMFVTSSISSFATPLGLLILSGVIALLLSILLSRRNILTFILVAVTISTAATLGYQYTRNNPLFYQAYSRIQNFINDPQSGGYDLNIPGVYSRWYLAEISFETFQAKPLFGMGGPREYNPFIGGHSSFFDSLAIYGILGGGGALCGILLILLANAALRFWRERNWANLVVLTAVLLILIAGIADPYWEGALPLVLIVARPFSYGKHRMAEARSSVKTQAEQLGAKI